MSKIENYTTFYTEKFDEHLCDRQGIISLNIGDRFKYNGYMYEIVWKLLNATDMIMIYHGKLVAGS